MRYRNSIIIIICFMAIAFATISTTLIIRGSTKIGINEDDFNVYFSDVKVNGVQDLSIVTSERELIFSTTMKSKNETYVLDYDVTNGSKNYDAALTMTCTGGNEYLSVTNAFDTSINLLSSETRSGKLTITLVKQNTGESLETEIKCTITATGVERTELDTGTPAEPVEPIPPKWLYTDSDVSGDISKGDLIILASNENETFNVISQTDDTVTMLASYVLGIDYRQTKSKSSGEYGVSFASTNGWEYTPGPKEIDIQLYDGNAKTYVNEYVSYLQEETGDTSITGDLITLAELGTLSCTYPSDYSDVDAASERTCESSEHASWLGNGQYWWTRSALADNGTGVWSVYGSSGLFGRNSYSLTSVGVRPVITISKSEI